ncbi:phosphate acetyltransferase [Austwickia chelonae]|uniref:Phosphate acetyltransferase n=1 Tax=Austwickia chelonae NBRC 105200 TaxID=1184607 RepID=K6V419_9MICO|nr:phosphate acyltransferase [Austwickia chelonae]GAB76883.1 phosphate acetyltransferase [Austwickia chelonae NBRC 105200]SEW31941.1 phosphate acetyltransferase [Austwickia chelonae]
MARRILVVPLNPGAGVTSACLGLVHALEGRHLSVGFAKPFGEVRGAVEDSSTSLFRLATSLRPPQPIDAADLENRLALGRLPGVMTNAVELISELDDDHQILVLEGMVPSREQFYASRINVELARSLDTEVVLVGTVEDHDVTRFAELAATVAQVYQVHGRSRVVGVVANRVPEEVDHAELVDALGAHDLSCAAIVDDYDEFGRPRISDLVRDLGLEVFSGDLSRRVSSTVIAAQTVPGFLPYLTDGALVVAPGDRHDVLMAVALAEAAGIRLAGLLMTVGVRPDPQVMNLVGPALSGELPLLSTSEATFPTATRIVNMDHRIPADDEDRARRVMEIVAQNYDQAFLDGLPLRAQTTRTTPAQLKAFLRAQMSRGHIHLAVTDVTDHRLMRALYLLQRHDALRFTALVDRSVLDEQLALFGESRLPINVRVLDPAEGSATAAGLQKELASAGLHLPQDSPLLHALALIRDGEVDGLVGGLDETRSHFLDTVQAVIPLLDEAPVISAAQAVLLPDEVVFVADTLFTAHPDAASAAAIAVRTAETARMCGVSTHVAFIAPSSSSPTAEADRATIAAARAVLAEHRPDLVTCGPVSFHQATTGSVPGRGNPSVFVFPDVASAAATAKALDQGNGTQVYPPLLQGLSKAVNLLPKDADVGQIMDLIVATAVQAADLG